MARRPINNGDTRWRARDSGDLHLPRKFQHPGDVSARDGAIMERKRAGAWTENVSEPGRVYQVISDLKSTKGMKGAPNNVGYAHSQAGATMPAIRLNKATGKYEMVTELLDHRVTLPSYSRSNLRQQEADARAAMAQTRNLYRGQSW